MIAGLEGSVVRFGPSTAYINCSGVVYEVYVPLSVFQVLQGGMRDKPVYLHIYHQFYQDGQRLFGFLEAEQRELFAALQTIKGLGSTLALSILSHMDGRTLLSVCESGDVKALTKIPRVGKSTAETIAFEVGRKKEKWHNLILSTGGEKAAPVSMASPEEEMAYEALVQLGYKEAQVKTAIEKIKKSNNMPDNASDLIRICLGHL